MYKLWNSIPNELIYIMIFIILLFLLFALFILINPNFLFGYYSPDLLGLYGFFPWFNNGYTGLYDPFGYGWIYASLLYPYVWGSPFLYNPFLWGTIGSLWNIYGNSWQYPYASLFGELLLVVPPAGDPIFVEDAATTILVGEALIATASGFLDVPLSPEDLIILTDPILNVLSANPGLLPDFWVLYPDLAATNPDLYAAILLI